MPHSINATSYDQMAWFTKRARPTLPCGTGWATHLTGAGHRAERDTLLADPDWLVGELTQVGPRGLESDLLLSDSPTLAALATAVRQNAHVLGWLAPQGSLAAALLSRIPPDDPRLTDLRGRAGGLPARPAAPGHVAPPGGHRPSGRRYNVAIVVLYIALHLRDE
jgi:hypothetical protein